MRTDLWATPVWEFNTLVDCKKLLSELDNIPQQIGENEFNIWNYTDICPELLKLQAEILSLANSSSNSEYRMERGWVSVQDKGQSLPPHNHGRVSLVACIYLQVPPNSGGLWLLDPRGGVDWQNQSYGNIDCVKGERIEPTTGKIVMFPGHVVHYTEANLSEFRRISLATNITKKIENT